MTHAKFCNLLGISAEIAIEPSPVLSESASKISVTVTIERGSEAVAGVHKSESEGGKLQFGDDDHHIRPFAHGHAGVLVRPSKKPRVLLPPDECEVTAKPNLVGNHLDYVLVHLDAETGDGQKVGLKETGRIPIEIHGV